MDYLAFIGDLTKTYGYHSPLVKADTTFEELGMDDYDIVDFLMDVEMKYGFVIRNEDLLKYRSMQDIMDIIKKSTQEDI